MTWESYKYWWWTSLYYCFLHLLFLFFFILHVQSVDTSKWLQRHHKYIHKNYKETQNDPEVKAMTNQGWNYNWQFYDLGGEQVCIIVFYFGFYSPWFWIHVKCVHTFCQNETDCLKFELEREMLTSWRRWVKCETHTLTLGVRQMCVFCFSVWRAMTERFLFIFIDECLDPGLSGGTDFNDGMELTFLLHHASTLLLWCLCIFSESIKVYTAYSDVFVVYFVVNCFNIPTIVSLILVI